MAYKQNIPLIDKEHIRAVNRTNLAAMMKQDGFELVEDGEKSYLVSVRGMEQGRVFKGYGNSFWQWVNEEGVSRNAIQYVQHVRKLSFPDAVHYLDNLASKAAA